MRSFLAMSPAAGSQSAHVGLNLVYLVPGETGGMEVYARELVNAMRVLPNAPRLTAFVNKAGAAAGLDWLDGIPTETVAVDARRRTEWVRGEQQLLPGMARRAGVDLVHSLASTAPVYGPYRRVTTVHDLIYLVHPEAHFGVLAVGLRLAVGLAVRRSHRLIAVSQSTARDLEQQLQAPVSKIDVVPNGVLPPAAASHRDPAAIRARYDLGDRPVVLAASAKRPHKNLPRLLDALASLPGDRRPLLLLPGYPTEHEAELRRQATALGLDSYVRFLGWVESDELEDLYDVAAAFIMPSLYEGFGLPVLEAMARGVPVACSDRSSLPEVAGDAAVLVDPLDTEAIARGLAELLGSPERRAELSARGVERAREFSWERTARETRDVLLQLASTRS
jgi:glycosyltransferase involved in cell wall biosynthesis